MAMNNRQRKVARSAIALPLIASLAFQAPLAQAQDTSKADGQRTIVQIKTKGLSPDAEFKLIDRNGEEFKKAVIGKNGAVTFLLDKSDSKKKLVGFQVDGKKYMTDTGKCKGANLLDPRNMPDSHISKAVEDAVKEKQAEKEGDKSEEKTEKENSQDATQVEENSEAPGEGEKNVKPSGEESSKDPDKNTEGTEEKDTPQGDKKEESRDKEESKEKNPEGEKKEGKTDGSNTPVENKDEKPTDGSNTPVAKPKAFVFSFDGQNGNEDIVPVLYDEKSKKAEFVEDTSPEIKQKVSRIIDKTDVEALRGEATVFIGAGAGDIASKMSPETVKAVTDFLEKMGDEFPGKAAEFIVQNREPIMAIAHAVNTGGEVAKWTLKIADGYYSKPFVKAYADKGLRSIGQGHVVDALANFEPQYKQIENLSRTHLNMKPADAIKVLAEVATATEGLADASQIANTIFKIAGVGSRMKKTYEGITNDDKKNFWDYYDNLGTEDKTTPGGKKKRRRGSDGIPRNPDGSIQKDYYAELERIQRDEGVINQAVADSIAAGMSGRPVKMDVNDDTFDMYNLTKRDVVDCEFSFVPAVGVSDVDSSVQATGDGTVVATKKTGSSSSGSDFDIKNYFGEITTDKAVEEQRTVSRSASTGVKTQPVNKTQQEVGEGKTTYSTTNETLGRAGASVSGATGQTSVVTGQDGISQIPATAVSYGKKTGPRVDTGGQVEVPWWKKVAALFVG